jgi:hypothetical protein
MTFQMFDLKRLLMTADSVHVLLGCPPKDWPQFVQQYKQVTSSVRVCERMKLGRQRQVEIVTDKT